MVAPRRISILVFLINQDKKAYKAECLSLVGCTEMTVAESIGYQRELAPDQAWQMENYRLAVTNT